MRENMTEIVFVIDKSGSMEKFIDDTIGSFNSIIKTYKKEDNDVSVTTILFDTEITVLYDRMNIDNIPILTEREYIPSGYTALFDALGSSIYHVINIHKHLPIEEYPHKTIMIIITDGAEDNSSRYEPPQIKRMIERQKKETEWDFVFLGANSIAKEIADTIGAYKNYNYKYTNN